MVQYKVTKNLRMTKLLPSWSLSFHICFWISFSKTYCRADEYYLTSQILLSDLLRLQRWQCILPICSILNKLQKVFLKKQST